MRSNGMDTGEQILQCRTFAVAGASQDPGKYGSIVFRRLLAAGYEVLPVNPGATEIDGHLCHTSITEVPNVPEAVICVTPPDATEKVAKECARLSSKGLRFFWMQPGAESPAAEHIAKEAGLVVSSGRCILQELSRY